VHHVCDSSDRPPALHLSIARLGAVMPAPADVGLNPADKGLAIYKTSTISDKILPRHEYI